MDDDRPSNTDVTAPSERVRDSPRQGRTSTDELHRLLTNSRRRLLLSYLTGRGDDPASVDDLVDAVAERERPDPGPATHRDRIAIDLHHVHLPKLADVGVIDYDPVAGTVRYDGSGELESLLATSNEVG